MNCTQLDQVLDELVNSNMNPPDYNDRSVIGTLTSVSEMSLSYNAHKPDDEKEIILVCGTVFIMPEARQFLGVQEPRDDFDLNSNLNISTMKEMTVNSPLK